MDQTISKIKGHLRTLKLFQMEKALDGELAGAVAGGLAVSTVVERLLEIEINALIERRIERRIKESRLPERKLLADFDFAFQKGLDKAQIMELATLSLYTSRVPATGCTNPGSSTVHSTRTNKLEVHHDR